MQQEKSKEKYEEGHTIKEVNDSIDHSPEKAPIPKESIVTNDSPLINPNMDVRIVYSGQNLQRPKMLVMGQKTIALKSRQVKINELKHELFTARKSSYTSQKKPNLIGNTS